MMGAISFLVWPKLQEMYRQLGLSSKAGKEPDLIMMAIVSTAMTVMIPVYTGRWDKALEKKLSESGGNKMISKNEIPGAMYEKLVLIGLAIGMGYLIMTMMLPIYSLTLGV